MKKTAVSFLTIILAIGFAGCGHTVGDMDIGAGENAIYIQESGDISYATAESFDKDYYDKGDLEDKIDKEIEDYNNSNKASVNDAAEVKDFSVKKDVATMVLNFVTGYDFYTYMSDYNKEDKEKFYIGKISDNSYCDIDGEFVSPDKKDKADGEDIKELKDKNILVVNGQYKIQSEYKILYMSDNCTVDEEGIITTAKSEDELSYIVYSNEIND